MAQVRCYAELNDHLPAQRRQVSFPVSLPHPVSAGEVIASLGVPREEVDIILLNGESVGLHHLVADADRLALYPVFETFDISALVKLRDGALRRPRFVLDVHLGKLANHLRMLGFDSLYRNDFSDHELESIAVADGRTLLSKDRALLQRERITRGYHVREKDPERQIVEVMRRFDLSGSVRPFTRCIECNAILSDVEKSRIIGRLPPLVRDLFNEFQHCGDCDRVYWKGSHFERMRAFVERVTRQGASHEG